MYLGGKKYEVIKNKDNIKCVTWPKSNGVVLFTKERKREREREKERNG